MMDLWRIQGAVDQNGKSSPRWLRFSAEADSAMRAFERWLEPQLAEGQELSHLAGWSNKLAGGMARIAAILHLTAAVGQSGTWPATIDRDTVDAAIRIGRDYLLPHALAAFGLMGADPYIEDARRVLAWISVNHVNHVNGPQLVSKRDIHALVLGSRYSTEDAEAIVNVLVKRGYLRLFLDQEKKSRGGRPGVRYEIHPAVFKIRTRAHGSHGSQNREPGEEG
jgi:hypothetical protein